MSTWIKLHDNFFRNPKVLAAGSDAALLYVQGLCYCSGSLTDGAIPTAALRHLTDRRDARTLARVLVREGLWIETSTGWQVHDYLTVQRSRAQVENEREKARDRATRSRSRHAVTNAERAPEVAPDVRVPETDTETEPPPPTPSRQPRDPRPPAKSRADQRRGVLQGPPRIPDVTEVLGDELGVTHIEPGQAAEIRRLRSSTFGAHSALTAVPDLPPQEPA